MAHSSIPLSPPRGAPFSLHLAVGEEGSAGPFVDAGEPGAGERSHLALLVSETGAVLDRLALILPSETAGLPGEEPESNGARETRWEQTRRQLADLAGGSPWFCELVLPAAGEQGPALWPPTLYCPVPQAFFALPCPTCLAPLATVRDDASLARAGLALYSSTAERYLHCPRCSEDAEQPRFFTSGEVTEELSARGVESLEEVRSGLAATLGGTKLPPEAAEAAERIPCASCPEAGPCLGGGKSLRSKKTRHQTDEAAPFWVPLTLHDSSYRVIRLPPWSFDRFADLLGGARPQEADLPAGPGLLFAGDASGLDAVEILCLKLTAFHQLVQAVKDHYRLLGRSHLDLHPEHLAVEPAWGGGRLPYLWSFRVKLRGPSPARRESLAEGVEVTLAPPSPRLPYCSPAVQASSLVQPHHAELVIDRVTRQKARRKSGRTGGDTPDDASERWSLEGRLIEPNGFFPRPTLDDLLLLTPAGDLLGESGRSLAARPDPRRETGRPGQLALTTEPFPLGSEAAARLEQSAGLRLPRVRYRLYPALGLRDDLYSLGILLMRLLLVHDGRSLGDLEPLVAAVTREPAEPGDLRNAPRPSEETLAASVLSRFSELSSKSGLFFLETDRAPDRPNSIPDELWREVLRVALRLVARGSERSAGSAAQAASGGQARQARESEEAGEAGGPVPGAGHPVDALGELLNELEVLVRRLEGLLFHRQGAHLELQSVIAEILTEGE